MVLGLGGGSIAQTGAKQNSLQPGKMQEKVLEENWMVKVASEEDAYGESWSTTTALLPALSQQLVS